jgi:hypothetical protein
VRVGAQTDGRYGCVWFELVPSAAGLHVGAFLTDTSQDSTHCSTPAVADDVAVFDFSKASANGSSRPGIVYEQRFPIQDPSVESDGNQKVDDAPSRQDLAVTRPEATNKIQTGRHPPAKTPAGWTNSA